MLDRNHERLIMKPSVIFRIMSSVDGRLLPARRPAPFEGTDPGELFKGSSATALSAKATPRCRGRKVGTWPPTTN